MTQSGGQPTTQPMTISEAAIEKCRRQRENCLRIGTAFYIWCEYLSRKNAAWLIASVVVTVLTMVQMLLAIGGAQTDLITGALMLVTTGALAGYFAFNRDAPLDEIRESANQFIGLSDQFEHTAAMTPEEAEKTPEETSEKLMDRFFKYFEQLIQRKDAIWAHAPLLPEWCLEKAKQRSHNKLVGNLSFDGSARSESIASMWARLKRWFKLNQRNTKKIGA
jgi:hypothetical protein